MPTDGIQIKSGTRLNSVSEAASVVGGVIAFGPSAVVSAQGSGASEAGASASATSEAAAVVSGLIASAVSAAASEVAVASSIASALPSSGVSNRGLPLSDTAGSILSAAASGFGAVASGAVASLISIDPTPVPTSIPFVGVGSASSTTAATTPSSSTSASSVNLAAALAAANTAGSNLIGSLTTLTASITNVFGASIGTLDADIDTTISDIAMFAAAVDQVTTNLAVYTAATGSSPTAARSKVFFSTVNTVASQIALVSDEIKAAGLQDQMWPALESLQNSVDLSYYTWPTEREAAAKAHSNLNMVLAGL